MSATICELECTITGPEGQEFTAHGAIFDLNQGGCLYVQDEGRDLGWRGRTGNRHGNLITWHGEVVGRWYKTGEYYNNFGAWITCLRATVDGREYYGRYGSDWSQLIWLRPKKGGA